MKSIVWLESNEFLIQQTSCQEVQSDMDTNT